MTNFVNQTISQKYKYHSTLKVLAGKLSNKKTVEWAAKLKPFQTNERNAVKALFKREMEEMSEEPWRKAWRIIFESWDTSLTDFNGLSKYQLEEDLANQGTSIRLADRIAENLRPSLKVELKSKYDRYYPLKKAIRKATDIVSVSVQSAKLMHPTSIKLNEIEDIFFLKRLADQLNSNLVWALDLVNWLGTSNYLLGLIYRIDFVEVDEALGHEQGDIDKYSEGIAPTVKMLFAVVSRLIKLQPDKAMFYLDEWKSYDNEIHKRLYSNLLRIASKTKNYEVMNFIEELSTDQFWNSFSFPEIALLRAEGFKYFDEEQKIRLVEYILKRPPVKYWPRIHKGNDIENARNYNAFRELVRIRNAGNELGEKANNFLSLHKEQFIRLWNDPSLTIDFNNGVSVSGLTINLPNGLDILDSKARLKRLEDLLNSQSISFDDNPSENAARWIENTKNCKMILNDLVNESVNPNEHPSVLQKFLWAHTPRGEGNQEEFVAERALSVKLFDKFESSLIEKIIYPLTVWIERWGKGFFDNVCGQNIWQKVWPFAVAATNKVNADVDKDELNVEVWGDDKKNPQDLDTLNSPVGMLVGTIFKNLDRLDSGEFNLDTDPVLSKFMEIAINVEGRSKIILLHRLLEHLQYFHNVAPQLFEKYLLPALREDSERNYPLWRAIARQTLFRKVLINIKDDIPRKILSNELPTNAKKSLLFSVVIDCLHALKNKTNGQEIDLIFSKAKVLEILRRIDDDLRAHAANSIQRFISEVKKPEGLGGGSWFIEAAKPFIDEFWPKEMTLRSSGVAREFADLPASSKDYFLEAFETVKPFLMPFDCWSMHNFGFKNTENGDSIIEIIDIPNKAKALLDLLSKCIGETEDSTAPYELSEALKHIAKIDPTLKNNTKYKRLAAKAR